ncbi:MAG: ABC transporter substrate-binding protein [Alphaproteobacteria bacterium]|nr:ABC transporter substrate-binding protein [Alphaproteobacteria bacterium]
MQRRTISRRVLLGKTVGLAAASLMPLPAIAETRQVKFTLPWLAQGAYAFVYMANAKGFLQKRGIEMSIARGFGSFAAAQSIVGGQFDIGLCAAPALTLSIAKGLPLVALATTDYDATMGIGVLADSPIQKPQDLAGKKIASVPTSAEFPFLPAFAKKAGLDLGTVESVHVDNKVIEHLLEEKQVDAITNFASSSYPIFMSRSIQTRWLLYSTAGITNHGQTLTVTKDMLAKDPGFCEAMADAILAGLAFAMTDPDETVDLFLKALPEMALNPNAKEFARLGVLMWQHSVDKPQAREHGLGWSDPQAYGEMVELVMTYLAAPGVNRPEIEALFTNRFAGNIKFSDAQWAQIRGRVAEYDKVFS